MARAYTVATAALALDVTAKWIDNVLSHYQVPGVSQERQGVRRRISEDGLLILNIMLLLGRQLGIPAAHALELSAELAGSGSFQPSPHLTITINVDTIRARLLARLHSAVEIAPVPRRGRPPKQTGRLE